MAQYNVKNLFRHYNDTKEHIAILKERVEELEAKATKITPSYSEGSGGSVFNTSSKVENNSIKIADIKCNIEVLEDKIKEADMLLSMLKPYQRYLIKKCLINGNSFSSVAKSERTTSSNIAKMIDNAIEYLQNKKTGN